MLLSLFSDLCMLLFGMLFPAYSTFKALNSNDLKLYVKWMTYWIVFATFSTVAWFTDIFLSWFPFYYEIKLLVQVWLLPPLTNGSRFVFRRYLYPMLCEREGDIDGYISRTKNQAFKVLIDAGGFLGSGVKAVASYSMATIEDVKEPEQD